MPSAASVTHIKDRTTKIRKLISILRGKNGCAWDRLQTPATLAPLLIEEAYEVVEAIEDGTRKQVQEEIGDLLFLVFTLIAAEEEKGRTTYRSVVDGAVRKYITRHPHVFAVKQNISPDEILKRWEKHKAQKSAVHPIDKVPAHLPALYQVKCLYDKAARLGLKPSVPRSRLLSKKQAGRILLAAALRSIRSGIDPETALRDELRTLRKILKSKIA